MSERIVRGRYEVKNVDGSWRIGLLRAGTRVKLGEGDYLYSLTVVEPLAIKDSVHGQPIAWFPVSQLPVVWEPGPFAVMSSFDVRRDA